MLTDRHCRYANSAYVDQEKLMTLDYIFPGNKEQLKLYRIRCAVLRVFISNHINKRQWHCVLILSGRSQLFYLLPFSFLRQVRIQKITREQMQHSPSQHMKWALVLQIYEISLCSRACQGKGKDCIGALSQKRYCPQALPYKSMINLMDKVIL